MSEPFVDTANPTAHRSVGQPVGQSVLSGTWRVLFTPLVLAAVCGALAVYLNAQDLDRQEAPLLTMDVIVRATWVMIQLVAISTAIVIAIAVPLGILLTRSFARWVAPPILAVANIGQAVPSIGVLALFAVAFGIGREGVLFALVVYCLLSVLRNTMVGLQQVDPTLIEAARGMGMSKLRVLRKVELPLAVPVMLAGIRTALIINVGTAILATFTLGGAPDGSNGLGYLIDVGIRLDRLDTLVLAGGVLTAVLALLVDWAAGLVEERLRPRGLET
ncbi:MAG: ABC transporter permease subunit [Solirubrobacterales bacterium]|nr:ABC transporter permease subunit [Solirubrobacterales bacterium]